MSSSGLVQPDGQPVPQDLAAIMVLLTQWVDFHTANWMLSPEHRRPGIQIAMHMSKMAGGFVESARQELIDRFLFSYNAKWLVMCDYDTIPSRPATEMIARAEAIGAKLVAYPTPFHGGQAPGVMSNIFMETPQSGEMAAIPWHDLPWEKRDTLFTCASAGLGCTLIHREVLEKLVLAAEQGKQDWPFRAFWHRGRVVTGEDQAFFIKAGMLGYETRVDLGIPCSHRKVMLLNPNHAVTDLAPGEKAHPDAPFVGQLGEYKVNKIRQSVLKPTPIEAEVVKLLEKPAEG